MHTVYQNKPKMEQYQIKDMNKIESCTQQRNVCMCVCLFLFAYAFHFCLNLSFNISALAKMLHNSKAETYKQ